MFQPRRSQRIAAKNASKVPTSFPVIMEPNSQPTLRLSDKDVQSLEQSMPAYPNNPPEIDAQLWEYEALVEKTRCAQDTTEKLEAIQTQMNFLQSHCRLTDFFSASQLKEFHELMQEFHRMHDLWNRGFVANMVDAVRSNMPYYINTDPTSFTPGRIMEVLRNEMETHNLFVSTPIDLQVVYEDIRLRR